LKKDQPTVLTARVPRCHRLALPAIRVEARGFAMPTKLRQRTLP
jgi:hypothetical protein